MKNKLKAYEEKLANIEQSFADVKRSAEGLMAELKRAMDSAKEGADMAKVIVERYDEAQARIKALEVDKTKLEAEKASLVEQMLGFHERATMKARYELLKDYKQGLLIDAEVDEEIELYEELDGAETSMSVSAPASEQNEPSTVEPPIVEPSNIEPPVVEPPVSDEPPVSEDNVPEVELAQSSEDRVERQ